MKYDREERLEIGRQIYTGELTKYEAAKKYGIGEDRARDYMRLYRNENGLPSRNRIRAVVENNFEDLSPRSIEDYQKMEKSELICELIRVRIREERLKKATGWKELVPGDGSSLSGERTRNNADAFKGVPCEAPDRDDGHERSQRRRREIIANSEYP